MHVNTQSNKSRGRPRGRPSIRASKKVGKEGSSNVTPTQGAAQDFDKTLDIAQLFRKDLRAMMYGFGDDPVPVQESVELVGDIVSDYITTVLLKAKANAALKGRVTEKELQFLVRKDGRKFRRVRELLRMNEELKEARKAFQQDEMEVPDLSLQAKMSLQS
eukprot:TRINITY_DN50929_c0_g1_i3.p2 TRINITY_DN50929_c0_g1~~TRINITY_DN50929_c0_g1_i3.p2  ORF type:complete len:161 (-),score=18.28 TRINITY_DN50929_c0_g1_i3:300-782(-)